MRDDARTVSAREWRAVREGEAHAATKTSTNNTPESFIVGIGASGAVLAGAAIVFVTLVGLVSFNVWPTPNDTTVNGNIELSDATKGATPGASVTPGGATSVQTIASTAVPAGGAAGAGNAGNGNTGGHQGGGGAGKGPNSPPPSTAPVTSPPPPVTSPPPPVTSPPTSDSGNSDGSTGSGSGPPVQAGKDPAHPVNPTHPDYPHQNVSTGSKQPAGGDTEVTGKGPFAKPGHSSDSHSSSGSHSDSHSSSNPHYSSGSQFGSSSHGRGHGSSRSWH